MDQIEITPRVALRGDSSGPVTREDFKRNPTHFMSMFRKRNSPNCAAYQRKQVPERETVTDASQGVQLSTIQALARYWGTEYDCER